MKKDIRQAFFLGAFGKLPQTTVDLKNFVVKSGYQFVKRRGGVIYAGQFSAHIFKKDVRCICSVHHVHVNFPHAPAGIDRFFKVV